MKNLAALPFDVEPAAIQEFSQLKDNPVVLDVKKKKNFAFGQIYLIENLTPLDLCALKTISSAEKCQGTVGVILDLSYRCGTIFQELIQIYLVLTMLSSDGITLFM